MLAVNSHSTIACDYYLPWQYTPAPLTLLSILYSFQKKTCKFAQPSVGFLPIHQTTDVNANVYVSYVALSTDDSITMSSQYWRPQGSLRNFHNYVKCKCMHFPLFHG